MNRLFVFATLGALSLMLLAPAQAQNNGAAPDVRTKRPEAAPESQRPDHHEMFDDVRQLRGLKGEALEQGYLTRMLDHHQTGMEMARIALRKAKSPAVRRMAETMHSEHKTEINQMRLYLIQWYNNPAKAKPDPRMHDTLQKLGNKGGADFDRAFLSEMTRHHEIGILMSEPVRARAPHAELRRFATKIATGQRQEQRDMRRMASRL